MNLWLIASTADRHLLFVSDETLAIAVAIAMAESGGNETKVSPINSDGSYDVGLWQINSIHRRDHPTWTTEWLKNPENNAAAMATISSNGLNWRPWTVYKTGRYKDYLAQARKAVASRPTGAGIVEDSPSILEQIPGISSATSTFEALKDIATATLSVSQAVGKAGIWIASPNNWIRIIQVVGGIALGLVAVSIVTKPVVENAKGLL